MSACWRRFVPPPEQDNQGLAVPPEVDAISWTRVDPVLQNPRPDAFRIGQDAPPHAVQYSRDLDRGLIIQAIKPSPEWTAPLCIDVLRDLDHCNMVTAALPKW